MIKEVAGDILLTKADALAHGVAPNDDFKHGVSQSLRELWPNLYKDFRHYSQTQHPKGGGLWVWRGPGSKIIFNCFIQDPTPDHHSHPGAAKTSHLLHSLQAVAKACTEQGVKNLALTRIGTGVGKLEWAEVKPIVERVFADTKINVFVYTTFKKGVAANEL